MEIWAGLVLGFLGSLHCLGMCGPLIIALPNTTENKLISIFENILYNFGRVLTYTVMGGIFGLIGSSLPIAGYQQKISLFMGILILLVFFLKGYIFKYSNKLNMFSKVSLNFKLFFGKIIQGKGFFNKLLLGILNGLLPCGLVYVALASSIAFADLYNGALYMFLFGIGTIPMMFSIYLMKSLVGIKFKKSMQKLVPSMVIILGLLLILRGLALGIPMISPKMPEKVETKQELKVNDDLPPCCR